MKLFLRNCLGIASLSLLSLPLPAWSQAFDMQEVTCAEMVEIAEADDMETLVSILFWVDGYLSGVSGDTTFDPAYIGGLTEALLTACADAPDALILETAEAIGLQ